MKDAREWWELELECPNCGEENVTTHDVCPLCRIAEMDDRIRHGDDACEVIRTETAITVRNLKGRE